jgi:folate-binding protein YgfZ
MAPLTFGDVPGEYAAATRACAVFDETCRGRVRAGGVDAATFLHKILAGDVRGLVPHHGNRNLLLTPKGKVLFDLDLVRGEEDLELSIAPGCDEKLVQSLDHYVFTEDVGLEITTGAHAPLDLVGPGAAAVLEQVLGLAQLEERETCRIPERDVSVTRQEVFGRPGYRVDAGAEVVELWDELREAGATPAGIVVRDILRVETVSALFGVDIDENVYPQEARLESAFDLDKGCYVGQEVVAKIDTYGGLNKRLMALRIDNDDPVPSGTRLLREERDLGVTTSWAYSFALDAGVVLAYVKRRHQEPGTVFRLGDSGATATIVAPPLA